MKTLVKYDSIDIYNNREILYMRKSSNKIISWITILIIGSIVLFFIIYFYRFKMFSIYNGKIVKNEEENYVLLSVEEDFLKYKNRNYLIINESKYRCHVDEVSDSYILLSNKKYYEVKFECNLKEEININNNIVEIKIDESETTLFEIIIKNIKKGIKNGRTKN